MIEALTIKGAVLPSLSLGKLPIWAAAYSLLLGAAGTEVFQPTTWPAVIVVGSISSLGGAFLAALPKIITAWSGHKISHRTLIDQETAEHLKRLHADYARRMKVVERQLEDAESIVQLTRANRHTIVGELNCLRQRELLFERGLTPDERETEPLDVTKLYELEDKQISEIRGQSKANL